jgi:hypothetical protein
MTGTSVQNRLLADIEASGGWDAIWERVASGETQTSIAAGLNVTQGMFARVLHSDPERTRAFREAKRQWATALIEQTGELVKNVQESRDAIGKVREQASHNRWEASKWDREIFGEDKGDVQVNVVNLGQMHLDALRHRIVEASRPGLLSPKPEDPPALTPPEEDETSGGYGSEPYGAEPFGE